MAEKHSDAQLELSVAELEALEANPRRPRKNKKALKRKGKPRDSLGRFAPKLHAA